MDMKYIFLFVDVSIGHGVLAAFLFSILDEPITMKRVRKLPLLLISPLVTTGIICLLNAVIPSKITEMIIGSFSNFMGCVLWVRWAWRFSFWTSWCMVCMAGMMQVAVSSLHLMDSLMNVFLPEWAADMGKGTEMLLLVLVVSFFLRRIGFAKLFRFLLEMAKIRTGIMLFLLLILMEGAFFLGLSSYSVWDRIAFEYYLTYDILVTLIFFLVVGGIVSVAQRLNTNRRLQAQRDIIAQQMLYERGLEQLRQEMRTFRHDYKNILSGMAQQAGQGEIQALSRELEKLGAGFDRRLGDKIQESTQIGNLRIPQVRSLFLAKLVAMEEKGVECRLEVFYPVEVVNMDIWDYVRCLGVLVDNAIEASLETEKPWVEIVLLQQGGNLAFRVSNSWTGKVNTMKMWNEGYSTKGTGRGMGLTSFRRILREYPEAVTSTSWTGEEFVQELTVPGESADRR